MRKCKFNEIWMENDIYKRKLAPAEKKICKKTFSLGAMGIKAVESHMKYTSRVWQQLATALDAIVFFFK